jgi:hypothetical protein
MTAIVKKDKIYNPEKETFPSYLIRAYFQPRFEGDMKTIDCSGLKERNGKNLTSKEFSEAVSDDLERILSGSGYTVFTDLSRFSGEISVPDIASYLIDSLGQEPEKIEIKPLIYESSNTPGYSLVAKGNVRNVGERELKMQLYGLR